MSRKVVPYRLTLYVGSSKERFPILLLVERIPALRWQPLGQLVHIFTIIQQQKSLLLVGS
jgi:hypothetical protein